MSGSQVEDWVAGLLAPEAPAETVADAPVDAPADAPVDAPAEVQVEVQTDVPAEVVSVSAPVSAPEVSRGPVPAVASAAVEAMPPASTDGEKSMNVVAEKTEIDEPPRRYVTFRVARETY